MKKQKSGYYRTAVTIGSDADGKPIRKWISGKTKKELEQARAAVVAKYIDCTEAKEDMLFGDFAVQWFRVRKEPFLARATILRYKVVLNQHILPWFGDKNLRAIKNLDCQEFLNTFAGKSNDYITFARCVLIQILDFAVQDRYIQFNPARCLIKPKSCPKREKRAFTREERAKMEAAFPNDPGMLYCAIMFYTGTRPGEAAGLKWGDVDFKSNSIHIQRDVEYVSRGNVILGDVKTPKSVRKIPLPKPLKDILLPLRGTPETLIFHAHGSNNPMPRPARDHLYVQTLYKLGMAKPKYLNKDGSLPYASFAKYTCDFSPHTFRHNFITMCWESGMDIMVCMKIVGHTDMQTTRNIYTHLDESSDILRNSMDAMFTHKSASK